MDKILSAVKCVNCQVVLNSPVLLPCGHSICKSHVQPSSKSAIKCKQCGVDHTSPNEGFPNNQALAEIISTQVQSLDFGKIHQQAQESCRELQLNVKNAKTLIDDPNYYINDVIEELKNDVFLKREQLKLEIDQESEKLIKMLEGYAIRCESYLNEDEFKSKRKNQELLVIQIQTKLNDWNTKLNQIKFDEEIWKNITNDCQKEKVKLETEIFSLRKSLLQNEYAKMKDCISYFQKIRIDFLNK